jgi:hypothetical protein
MTLQWHDIFLMLIPVLISIITKPSWPGNLKYGVTIGICLLASIAEFYLSGSVQGTFWQSFAKSFLVIFATYAGIWKPSGVADKVESQLNG